MATTCSFGQIPDGRFKTICCNGRLFMDKTCGISVSNASVDRILSVDVGGNVNFATTTIDMKNTRIDFTGAEVTGLTGNIKGNITANNLVVDTIFANTFKGKLLGNVCGGTITGTFIGNSTTTTSCTQILQVSVIQEKDIGQGIMITSPISGTINGQINGILCGQAQVDIIQEKTLNGGINVQGNMNGNFLGSFCGNIATSTIREKVKGSGIDVIGNLRVTTFDVGNLQAGNFRADVVFANTLCGNITTNNISSKNGTGIINVDDNIIMNGNLFTFPGYSVTFSTGFINTITGSPNLIITSSTAILSNVLVIGNIETKNTLIGNLCSKTAKINKLVEKDGNGITIDGNIMVGNIMATYLKSDDILVGNLIVTGNLLPGLANIVVEQVTAKNLCGNISTNLIRPKNGGNIDINATTLNINGNTNINGNINIGNAYTLNGNVCGNLSAYRITNKENFDLIIDVGNIDDIIVIGNTIFQDNVGINGGLMVDTIETITAGNLELLPNVSTGTIFATTICAENIKTLGNAGNLTVVGNLNVDCIRAIGDGNVLIKNGVIADNFYGNFYGNLISNSAFEGNVTGNLCGNAQLYKIVAKNTNGNIQVFGNIILNSALFGDVVSSFIKDTTLTSGRVVIVDTDQSIRDHSGLTYNTSTGQLSSKFVDGSIPTDRVLYATAGGLFTSKSSFTFTPGTAITELLTTENILVTGVGAGGLGLQLQNGTNTYIPFFGAGGAINQSSKLIFASGIGRLTTENILLTGTLGGLGLQLQNGINTYVPFFGTGGAINQSASLTFSSSLNKLTTENLCVTGNLEIYGNLDVNGGINLSDININGELDVNGNVDIQNDLIVGNKITTDNLCSNNLTVNNKIITQDLCANGNVEIDGNLDVFGNLNVNSVTINNITVVGPQQATVAAVSAATTNTVSGAIGTDDGTLASVGDTSAGDESGTINNNFSDVQGSLNKLIADVDDIRTKFNDLLAKLKTHGLIA